MESDSGTDFCDTFTDANNIKNTIQNHTVNHEHWFIKIVSIEVLTKMNNISYQVDDD